MKKSEFQMSLNMEAILSAFLDGKISFLFRKFEVKCQECQEFLRRNKRGHLANSLSITSFASIHSLIVDSVGFGFWEAKLEI